MRTESALVSAAHANFLGSFRKLAEHAAGGEVRYVGTVFAFVTGVPAPLLNGCVLIDDCDPAALEEALLWVARSRLPFRVFVAGEPATALTAVLAAHSLSRDADSYPGMVLHPLPEQPVRSADIEVADGIEPGLATYIPESLPDDAEVRVFSARVDDQPPWVPMGNESRSVARMPSTRFSGLGGKSIEPSDRPPKAAKRG